jgi:hypothetical protein
MIPYDDLVAALSSWRARQGLPTEQLAGAPAPAPKAATPTPAPAAARPAAARPAAGGKPARAASPVAIAHDDSFDVDDSSLLEEASYEGDYAGYGGGEPGEATAIGTAPAPPRRGGR